MKTIALLILLTTVLTAENQTINLHLKSGKTVKTPLISIDSVTFEANPSTAELQSVTYYAHNSSLPPNCQDITKCTISSSDFLHYQYWEGLDSTGEKLQLQKEEMFNQKEYPTFDDLKRTTELNNIAALKGDYINDDMCGGPIMELRYHFSDSTTVTISYNVADTVELPDIIYRHHLFFHEHYFPQE